MTRIIIAEDHELVRKSLIKLIEQEPTIQVVGETGKGAEAISLAEKLRPNLLVCDLSLRDVHGLDVIRQVSPKISVLVCSMYILECYVLEAVSSGALGYVAKESAPTE